MDEIQHIVRATEEITKMRAHDCDDESKHSCTMCEDIARMAVCKRCGCSDELGIVAWMVNNHDLNPTFCYDCFNKAAPIVRGGALLCHNCLDPMLVQGYDTLCHLTQVSFEHETCQIYYSDDNTAEICRTKHVCED